MNFSVHSVAASKVTCEVDLQVITSLKYTSQQLTCFGSRLELFTELTISKFLRNLLPLLLEGRITFVLFLLNEAISLIVKIHSIRI